MNAGMHGHEGGSAKRHGGFEDLMQEVAERTRPGGQPTLIGALDALETIEAMTVDTAQDIEALLQSAEAMLKGKLKRNDPVLRLLSLAIHKAVELADSVNTQVVDAGAWTVSARETAGH